MSEQALREQLRTLARSLFERGLTPGSTGNISARTPDGGMVCSPTGSTFRDLDVDRLTRYDADGAHVGGDEPTKEVVLHRALYDTRPSTGAVVHLHSTHAVAWSMVPGVDPDDLLPPLTAYAVMRLGRVALLPFVVPGDPAMGDAVRALGGSRSAVVLANHGPVVAGADLSSAVDAIEELEETARLALLLQGRRPRGLTDEQVAAVVDAHGAESDR